MIDELESLKADLARQVGERDGKIQELESTLLEELAKSEERDAHLKDRARELEEKSKAMAEDLQAKAKELQNKIEEMEKKDVELKSLKESFASEVKRIENESRNIIQGYEARMGELDGRAPQG